MNFDIVSPSDQVAVHLRKELYKRTWSNEMPGTPMLASMLNIDRKTITMALVKLEQEGLLQSQGLGCCRKITLPPAPPNVLNICILPYEETDQQRRCIQELMHLAQAAGHQCHIASKTLPRLGMNPTKIARYIEKNSADLWIPICASREVLEWFASANTPAFAIFGRRREVPLGSIGPDKIPAMINIVQRVLSLGHRRIVYVVRKERRLPKPGSTEARFLSELEAAGINTGPYNLPDWEENLEGFHIFLDRLFRHTPPTAILVDESNFFIATIQHLAQRGIVAPRDISLVCVDSDPVFDWCQPKISHIQWDSHPIAKETMRWINQLSRGENQRKAIFTKAEFIEGGTIGPVPKNPGNLLLTASS